MVTYVVILLFLAVRLVHSGPEDIIPEFFEIEDFELENFEIEDVKITSFKEEDIKLGGEFHRECQSVKPDEWFFYWKLPDNTLHDGPKISRTDLKLSDAGTYECVAINRFTGEKLTKWFNIDFPEKWERLTIRSLPGEIFEYKGNIRRDCFAGYFGWRSTWILPNGTNTDSQYLVIPQATRRNRGKYICIAKNYKSGRIQIGWIAFNFLRKAQLRLEVFTLPDNKILTGGTLALKCRASSYDWIVHWVTASGIREYSGVLKVENLKPEHIGKYWCIAKNRYSGRTVKMMYILD